MVIHEERCQVTFKVWVVFMTAFSESVFGLIGETVWHSQEISLGRLHKSKSHR